MSSPTTWSADLAARYELLEEAGRGGMGVVYKAKDRETGEIVALKILKPEIAADRTQAERFLNEVRLSRRITHKNVCRAYEFTRAGSTAYLSMEYVEGESLRAILERLGAVTRRKGTQIARQICAALYEAHSQGIVHRDLKPENVMLDRAGNVKVMDFGIARLLDASVTSTGGIIGTPAYMAPEQAEGREIDARTDIYATGLILYELFTGHAAFTGDTPITIALKQIRETPAAPRTHDPSISPALDAIILKCLEKDPAARFQSIGELDAALATVQPATDLPPPGGSPDTAGEWPTVEAANTTPVGKEKAPSNRVASALRRKAIFAGVAAMVAMALAAAYAAFWRARDPIPFTAFTLSNGLQVLLSEDHTAPTVAVDVVYNVGSRDDPPGHTGLAHLFEHMMFDGSLNVGKAEHASLVTRQGGSSNGQTSPDQTQFWETLPANQLDLALFLEADRMRSLRLDEARLRTVRATIAAERNEHFDNAAYGRAVDTLNALAYDVPGYKRSVIGTAEDLERTSLQEVNDFFRVFYAPNNAVLAVVGDFKTAEARSRIENYFQHIAAQPPAPVPDLSNPIQTAARRAELDDPFATSPRYYIGYKTPPGSAADLPAIEVLTAILAGGANSRLHLKLVKELEAASAVGGYVDQRAGPGLATFIVIPAGNRDEASIMKTFDEVVAQVRDQGVTPADIERARNRLRLADATAQQLTFYRARLLGCYAASFGGAAGVNLRVTRLNAVTPDAVKRAATAYLGRAQQTLLAVVPGGRRPAAVQAAQTPQSSDVERLDRAPISKDTLRVSLPHAKELTLDNGLTVLLAEERRVPLVAVRFDIRGAGPLHDPPDRPGTADAVASMLRQGTATRTGKEIEEQLDTFGAAVGAGSLADRSVTAITAIGLSGTFAQWFPVVADLVTNASMPADELSFAKRRLAADWRTQFSVSAQLAGQVYENAVYGAAAPPRVTPEAFAALTSDRLKAWHRERYAPQNTILTVAGAISSDSAERDVRAALDRWQKGTATEQLPGMPPAPPRRAIVMNRAGALQTSIVIGAAAVDRVDPDYLPLVVANRVLGGVPAARLFTRLREERGLTFAAFSSIAAYKHGGDWRAYGDVNGGRDGEAIDAFLEEIRRIAAEPIPAAELDAAKRSIVAGFAVTLEQLSQRVSNLATRRSYGLSADYWDRYAERILAVSSEDAQRAAAKYFDPSRLQIIAVGDASKLEPLLAAKAPVTIVR